MCGFLLIVVYQVHWQQSRENVEKTTEKCPQFAHFDKNILILRKLGKIYCISLQIVLWFLSVWSHGLNKMYNKELQWELLCINGNSGGVNGICTVLTEGKNICQRENDSSFMFKKINSLFSLWIKLRTNKELIKGVLISKPIGSIY